MSFECNRIIQHLTAMHKRLLEAGENFTAAWARPAMFDKSGLEVYDEAMFIYHKTFLCVKRLFRAQRDRQNSALSERRAAVRKKSAPSTCVMPKKDLRRTERKKGLERLGIPLYSVPAACALQPPRRGFCQQND